MLSCPWLPRRRPGASPSWNFKGRFLPRGPVRVGDVKSKIVAGLSFRFAKRSARLIIHPSEQKSDVDQKGKSLFDFDSVRIQIAKACPIDPSGLRNVQLDLSFSV